MHNHGITCDWMRAIKTREWFQCFFFALVHVNCVVNRTSTCSVSTRAVNNICKLTRSVSVLLVSTGRAEALSHRNKMKKRYIKKCLTKKNGMRSCYYKIMKTGVPQCLGFTFLSTNVNKIFSEVTYSSIRTIVSSYSFAIVHRCHILVFLSSCVAWWRSGIAISTCCVGGMSI